MGFAVFVVGSGKDFLKYAEVRCVAGFGDTVVGYRLLYGAAGLADMAAVAVFAVVGGLEDLGEEMSGVFGGEVYGAETTHSRNVDYLASIREVEHFGEGGGMGAGMVKFRNLTGA